MSDDITIGVTEIVNNIEVTAQPNDQIVDISVIDNADDVTLNITPTVIEINVNKGSSYAKWGTILGTLSDQTDLQDALNLKADLVDGKVPSSQLPSYVDDIIEVANYAALPATGEIGKIYVTIDNNKIFRWTGSTYVEIIDSAAVWGAITGTLSSQTDLQNALNLKANDNAVVKLTGDQTISGVKTFSNPTTFNSSLNIASGAYSILYNPANSAYWQTYVDSSNVFNFGYNGNIVKASISNSGNFTANSFIKSGGTSSQFLKADGSVDSSTYALTSQLHDAVTLGTTGVLNGLSLSGQVLSLATASSTTRGALTSEDYNYFFDKVQGNGNQNYIPKYIFSGSNKVIGNSLIYDNGTNVGIGTPSPVNNLHVQNGTTANTTLMIQSWGTEAGGEFAGIRFKSATTANNEYGKGFIGFRNNATGYGRGDLYFCTNNLTDTSNAGLTDSKMVITSGGNVGIGTNSPDQKLTVIGNVRAGGVGNGFLLDTLGVNFTNGMKVVNNYETVMFSGRGSSGYVIAGDNNLRFGFGTNYSAGESMRITSGGNVGIGTTSPAGKLSVIGDIIIGQYSDSVTNNLDIRTNKALFTISPDGVTNANGTIISYSWANGGQGPLRFNNASGEVMRLSSSGNVGIGTTSPSTKLDVVGAITASGGFFNSDMRLKDLIDYDYNVLDIKPITYLWKDCRDNKKHVGYSAQEVQKVMPDAVNEGTDGMLSVNYVEVLVAKIAELENRIKQLEK